MYKDKQKQKAYKKEYYLKNKQKMLDTAKKWNDDNPERVGWTKRNYNRNHPELCKHTKTSQVSASMEGYYFECNTCGTQFDESMTRNE